MLYKPKDAIICLFRSFNCAVSLRLASRPFKAVPLSRPHKPASFALLDKATVETFECRGHLYVQLCVACDLLHIWLGLRYSAWMVVVVPCQSGTMDGLSIRGRGD